MSPEQSPALQAEEDVKDTRSDMWLLNFCSLLSKKHFRGYMEVLSDFSSAFSPSLFADMLDMAGRERFPEGTAAMVEFCRRFHQSHCNRPFSLLSKKWIQSCSFERKHYARVIEWAACEENEDVLDFLSRMSPPPDLSPGERKAATDIWKTKLRKESPPWLQERLSDRTRVFIQNQLYLLSDSHEEKLQILLEVLPLLWLPSLDRSLLSMWATRLTKHCRECPADERCLREYFLNLIRHYKPAPDGDNQPAINRYHECQEKYLTGWFGIVHLGAGESEFRLLDIVRTQSEPQMPNFTNEQLKWELLSRWQPVSPRVQAELLDWWQSLPVTTAHAALQPRWKVIFSLEKDESRLVQLIEELPDNVFPQEIPDGWFPHSPQLQERLVKAVPERLNAFIAQIHQGVMPPKSLWQLLFRLPISGSRILDFIHRSISAVNIETDFLPHITNLLQSPGLPPDTSKEDIRQTVETIVRHQKRQYNHFNSLGIKDNVFMAVVELLREYVRCGTSGPVTNDGSSIDPAWIHSTLEFLTNSSAKVDDVVVDISENWKETSPPHARFLIQSLWLAGIRCLASYLSAPYQYQYKIEVLLMALHRLTRKVYPPGSPGTNPAGVMSDDSVSSTTSPFPPQLWETLSTAVTQTRDEKTFLLAVSVGNYLARYANPDQQQRWVMTIHNNILPLASTGIPAVLRQNFLLNNLVSELEHFRGGDPGEQTSDTTELLRFLRKRMYLFPDPPGSVCGFWAEIWKETFKTWKMEHIAETPAKTRNRLPELKMPEFIEKPFPPPLPASAGQSSSTDCQMVSPGQNRQ